MNLANLPFTVPALRGAYAQGATPRQVWDEFRRRLKAWDDPALFLSLAEEAHLEPIFAALEGRKPADLPLFGVPFALKDNIDWAPLPTTAACPGFAYKPDTSATVVDKLIAAGAFPVGKTNLDQFATGLVGTRSPYGTPRNAVAPGFIPGGSSSGSASAVAAGLVAFALGTDTAGSGRVPAAFQGLVGWKPTVGLVSTSGVFPACRTLDCVAVFTKTVDDARAVAAVVEGFDATDPYSRPRKKTKTAVPVRPRIGIPQAMDWTVDPVYGRAWDKTVADWSARGADLVPFDASPLREAARLLYEGPWVAERLAAVKPLWDRDLELFHPVTRTVLKTAEGRTAVDTFQAYYRLEGLKRKAEAQWKEFDFLLFPTTPTLPTLAQVEADPIGVNSLLGTWTNFFNLLDLAGLALPAVPATDGRPFGVTLAGPAGSDRALFQVGQIWESGQAFGAPVIPGPTVIAVAGAHLKGLPLNGQLVDRGARLLEETTTAAKYGLYAFRDGALDKPGLVRSNDGGIAVPVELWDMPEEGWGSFLSLIPHPLGLGKVELADGRWVTGFLMESSHITHSRDISSFGGWRAYLANREL